MINLVAEFVVCCVSGELGWLVGGLHVPDIEPDIGGEHSVYIILIHFMEDI